MPEQRFDPAPALQQQQTITPQMQQSLHLLQVPTLELKQLIRQELVQNPTLEEEPSEISFEETPSPSEDEEFDREYADLSRMDEEWREYMVQARLASPPTEDANERHSFALDSLIEPITLQDHLLEQLAFVDAALPLVKAVESLIGSLQEDGYLPEDAETLCRELQIPDTLWEQALPLLRSFDPSGVGAFDLRDCLLIQLDRLDRHHSLEYRIVDHHLNDLARKRYPQIARQLGVSLEKVAAAATLIASLDPQPGSRFANSTRTMYVTPDVIIEKQGDDWIVIMNDGEIPRLRISNTYKDMMAGDKKRETRDYLREKIRAGKSFIRSIQQRQQTIRSIVVEIASRQRDFLEQGPSGLKPMTMLQVAEVVGVHETTVSRAVSGKFIQTPHGIFELKYFFTAGYETSMGETLSNISIKESLAELIAAEDPKRPFSDQYIVGEFEKRGISIARRTVAKYREELNILPTYLRKRY